MSVRYRWHRARNPSAVAALLVWWLPLFAHAQGEPEGAVRRVLRGEPLECGPVQLAPAVESGSIRLVPAWPRNSASSARSIPVLPIWNSGICNTGSGISCASSSFSVTLPT